MAVQIASDKTGEKVKDTITRFLEKKLDKKYSRLMVVLLVQKQNSYSFSYDTKKRISFSIKNDILNFSDLLTSIKKNDKIREVYEYIQKEFPETCKMVDFKMLDRIKGIIQSLEFGCERSHLLEILSLPDSGN